MTDKNRSMPLPILFNRLKINESRFRVSSKTNSVKNKSNSKLSNRKILENKFKMGYGMSFIL